MNSRFAQLDPADYRLSPTLRERLTSPALVVYLHQVRENIRRIIQYAGGDVDRWRPHVKTVKIPQIFSELLAAGVRNFKCATVRECRCLLETLDRQQVENADVLVAYPLVGPSLVALARLAAAHPRVRVSLLAEDPVAAPRLPEGLGVFVDVNPGMHRSGIPVVERDRILAVARSAAARFRGVHFYEGHLHGNPAERGRAAAACYEQALGLLTDLRGAGIEPGELVTSGTPTFLQALHFDGFRDLGRTVHRVSPGTVVFHDFRSEQEIEELDLMPAALVFSRAVSRPAPGRFTCDAGSKSLAAEAGDPCAYVIGHPDWIAAGPSEEHLPVEVGASELPALGSPLLLVPRHVCPTVNLAEQALLLDAGREAIVPVSARAHDLELL